MQDYNQHKLKNDFYNILKEKFNFPEMVQRLKLCVNKDFIIITGEYLEEDSSVGYFQQSYCTVTHSPILLEISRLLRKHMEFPYGVIDCCLYMDVRKPTRIKLNYCPSFKEVEDE